MKNPMYVFVHERHATFGDGKEKYVNEMRMCHETKNTFPIKSELVCNQLSMTHRGRVLLIPCGNIVVVVAIVFVLAVVR